MGYRTNYTLTFEPNMHQAVADFLDACKTDGTLEEFLDLLNMDTNMDTIISDGTYLTLELSGKWYSHEEDMLAISRAVPEIVIHLHGEGESEGDLWYKDFLNGRMQVRKAQIVYPPYALHGFERGEP